METSTSPRPGTASDTRKPRVAGSSAVAAAMSGGRVGSAMPLPTSGAGGARGGGGAGAGAAAARASAADDMGLLRAVAEAEAVAVVEPITAAEPAADSRALAAPPAARCDAAADDGGPAGAAAAVRLARAAI